MVKEVDIQAQIKKSVRLDGGYCHKLTNAFTVGIPDLLIALPPFAPCIIEVKSLGVVTAKFDQQIAVTPKQRHELNEITEVYLRYAGAPYRVFSGLFIHAVLDGDHWLTGLPRGAERHTAALLWDGALTRKRGAHGYWSVRHLLEAIGVTKV